MIANRDNGDQGGHEPEETWRAGGPFHELHELFLDAGVNAERSGALPLALTLYEQAVRSNPDSALAWYNYGDVLLALKRPEEAVEALCKAVDLSPKTLLFHYDLGLAFYELGHHEDAIRVFAPIVASDPQLKRGSSDLVLSSMTNLALCQGELGQPDEAAKTLRPTRQVAVNILYNLATLTFLAKRQAEALPLAQAAAALSPTSENAVHLAGRILLDLKREPEALEYLRQATRMNRHCTDAWYDLGLVLARLRRRKEARGCFKKVIRQKPDHAWAYYDLACLDALEKKRDAAFKNLGKAAACGFQALDHLCRDPDLRSMRHDARWMTLTRRIGASR